MYARRPEGGAGCWRWGLCGVGGNSVHLNFFMESYFPPLTSIKYNRDNKGDCLHLEYIIFPQRQTDANECTQQTMFLYKAPAFLALLHVAIGFQAPLQRRSAASALHLTGNDVNDNGAPTLKHMHINRRSAIAIAGSALFLPTASFLEPANAAKPSTASVSIPTWLISEGVEFPILALNTAGMSADETYQSIVYSRLEGITHIDFHPGDERDGVAKYLSDHKNERDSLFLNTKIRKAEPGTSPSDAAILARNQIQEDLQILGVDHVDMLMLRDSPDPKVIQAQWEVMEEALAKGQTRSIGVVNYCQLALTALLQTAKVTPAVNYIMVHVGMGKDVHGLRSFGESRGIRTFSYGQLGEPAATKEILQNKALRRIGLVHGEKTTEQVALRWVLQNGMAASIRPSSNYGTCVGIECRIGISRQTRVLSWSLSEEEMEELDALMSPDGNPTLFSSAGCPGAFGM